MVYKAITLLPLPERGAARCSELPFPTAAPRVTQVTQSDSRMTQALLESLVWDRSALRRLLRAFLRI